MLRYYFSGVSNDLNKKNEESYNQDVKFGN